MNYLFNKLTKEIMQKARVTKYIRRIPNPKGKGFLYFYTQAEWAHYKKTGEIPKQHGEKKGFFAGIMDFFGFKDEKKAEEKVEKDYTANAVKEKFKVSLSDWSKHIAEYFNNKLKWDALFLKKLEAQNAVKTAAPEYHAEALVKEHEASKKISEEVKKNIFNLTLMYFIYNFYNKEGQKNETTTVTTNPEDVIGIRSGELPADTQAVLPGRTEGTALANVPEREPSNNTRIDVLTSSVSGERLGLDVRLTQGQTIALRKQILALLSSKTDEEMTDADKALLRRYEGAGGLNKEEGRTGAAIQSEYYTPRNVIGKVWDIIQKYIGDEPQEILEPAAGTGRFADDKNHKFTMVEIDATSARINKILHPDAKVINAKFQAMFMKGNQSVGEYKGKKFKVVIGNPPYMPYGGIEAGIEGKIHTRTEEYFIDRGLDALEEGGIMAYVVPSSFLRKNQYSKAKSEIARKGRLLEAYRLPNGTFSTTAEGTDIIIVRKEAGNVNDFLDDKYFKEHPDNILGVTTTGINQFGKPAQFVSLKPGETFEEVLARIPLNALVPGAGQMAMSQTAKANISMALAGNKNAVKDVKAIPIKKEKNEQSQGDLAQVTESAETFNTKYNKKIDKAELNLWKNTDYSGAVEIDKLPAADRKAIELNENICIENGKYYHRINYVAGNIYAKLEQLEHEKDRLGDARYNRQKEMLEKAKPIYKTTKNFFVSPISDFAKDFMFESDEVQRDRQDDGTYLEIKGTPFNRKFLQWATGETRNFGHQDWGGGVSQSDLPSGIGWDDIMDYIKQKSVIAGKGSGPEGKMIADKTRQLRREVTEKLYKRFIETGLNEEEQKKLETEYNRIFNSYVEPDYSAVPLFVDGISTTFKGKPLAIKEKQMSGASRLCNKGNGVLVHDCGVGKGHLLTSDILTPDGWVKMSNIKIGDFVVGKNGKPTKITGVYPLGKVQCYRVTMSDGSFSDVSDEHLWNVQTPNYRSKYPKKWDVVLTKDIKDNLYNNRQDYKYSIPMVESVQFKKRKLKIHPYLLGVLLGDGGISQKHTIISSADEFIIEEIRQYLPQGLTIKKKNNTKYDYSIVAESIRNKLGQFIKGHSLLNALREYNLHGTKSNNKFIPDDYKYSTVEDRLALLQGLFDTDGYIGNDGYVTSISSASIQLINDITEMIQSLGGTVSLNHKQPFYTYNGEKKQGQIAHILTIRVPGNINLFRLPRKADKVKPKTKYIPVRFIESIEDIGYHEAQCIKVDAKDSLYICDNYIVTHNTMTGIIATVNQLQTGRAKRPVICVPKAVYTATWLKEVHDLFPNVKINELGNLGEDFVSSDLQIEDGTLSIMTYDALQKITFKPETINNDLIQDMLDAKQLNKEDATEKQNVAAKERLLKKLGMAVSTKTQVAGYTGEGEQTLGDDEDDDEEDDEDKAEEKEDEIKGASRYFEDLGFDHITVDEIHNFKNLFRIARNMEGGSNEFKGIGGSESKRAMKMFAMTQLIQKSNHGRNVFALSGTPFTNSPVEIYSILSYVARDRLKELRIYNLHEFMAQFADLKTEWAVKGKGDVQRKNVMKGFKNLSSLQGLIREYMDKVTAEDAGIIKPHSNHHVMYLEMSPLQKRIMEIERRRFDLKGKDNPGAALVALNNMRACTISPKLLLKNLKDDSLYQAGTAGAGIVDEIIASDLVEDSPKLKATFDTAVEVYNANKGFGQAFFCTQGTGEFKTMIKYLVSKGIPRDAIATLTSATSTSTKGKNLISEKDKIMADFNDPAGKIKFIIGSGTVKEGVNLNGNAAVGYNLLLGWNQSDVTQWEARIDRQGNKQKEVHLITPLLVDSVDSAMYQKLDEKKSRFDAIWNFKGDVLETNDAVNPEELKFELIKDPERRANFMMDLKSEKIESDKNDKLAFADTLKNFQKVYGQSQQKVEYNKKQIPRYEENITEYQEKLSTAEKELKTFKANSKPTDEDYKYNLGDKERDVKDAKEYLTDEKKELKDIYREIEWHTKNLPYIESKCKNLGVNFSDIDKKAASEQAAAAKMDIEIEAIKNDKAKYVAQAIKDIAAKNKPVPKLREVVKTQVGLILSNLKEEAQELTKAIKLVFKRYWNPETEKYKYKRIR